MGTKWSAEFDAKEVMKGIEIIKRVDLDEIGFWKHLVPKLRGFIDMIFTNEGYRGGTNSSSAWLPLSPDTWAQKSGSKAMEETGKLRNAAHGFKWTGEAREMILRWSAKAKGFDYAGFHQRDFNAPPIYKWAGNPGHGGRPVEFSDRHEDAIAKEAISVLARKAFGD